MIFYLSMGVLFSVYALDLLFLVVVAAIARSAEIAGLLAKKARANKAKKAQEAAAKKAKALQQQQQADGGATAAVTAAEPAGPEPAPAPAAPPGRASSSARSSRQASAAAAVVAPPPPRLAPITTVGSGSSEFSSNTDTTTSSTAEDSSEDDGLPHAEIIIPGAGDAAADDPWGGSKAPKVLVQLPMYNEEAHAAAIIEACCRMRYPRDRLLIQVLDDSTKEHVRQRVDACAAVCAEMGHPVQVMRRDNRSGFKAGAMVEGLNRVEGLGFEYCAIFDADFDPPEDFLEDTIPAMHRDRTLAYVQTRWDFSNGNESFLTWAQKVNLAFHFDVEQRARSYLGWFFNFNGTAGVWRIQSIHDAGGWQSDTVVEDMDLSLRCYLKGWNALYLPHVDNPNELPCTLSSYKTQQFRWLSGPMQILIKSFSNIWHAKDISIWRRINAFWFFMRYILFATITVGVLAIPPVALWVEEWNWEWPHIFFVVAINFALAVYLYITPFSIAYLFFSVAIGYFKLWAMISGLLGLEKSKTWKVTQKFGAKQASGSLLHRIHKPYALEALLALFYAGMAAAAGIYASWIMLGYCCLMALVFVAISFGDAYM